MSSTENKIIRLCRLCTMNVEEEDGENDLFSKSNKPLLQQIKEITGITIKNMTRHKLPRHFCKKCKDDLSCSYEFRLKVIKSQSYFKSEDYQTIIGVSQQIDNVQIFDSVFIPSYDDKIKEEDESSSCKNETKAECTETLIDIKMSPNGSDNDNFELDYRKKQCNETDTKPANCSLNSQVTTVTEKLKFFSDQSIGENSSTENNEDVEDTDFVATFLDDDFNEDSSDSVKSDLKAYDTKRKRKAIVKTRKDANSDNSSENRLNCQICEISFKTQKQLQLHWRNKHKREKKIKCDLCDQMFFTTKSLLRHSNFHKGEKAYKCHYCEMTFTYSSHRTRHERRHHSRDCAFLCSLCGKTFTTHDMGKNHMLVHTKERAFNCTVCNTSFLRKTHLTTHYRSETHKNNEQKLKDESQATTIIFPVLNLHLQNNEELSQEPLNVTVCNEIILQQSPEV